MDCRVLYGYGVVHLSHIEKCVDGRYLVSLNDDPSTLVDFETSLLNGDGVAAHGQFGKGIETSGVGCDALLEPCIEFAGTYAGVGDHRATDILYRSGYASTRAGEQVAGDHYENSEDAGEGVSRRSRFSMPQENHRHWPSVSSCD